MRRSMVASMAVAGSQGPCRGRLAEVIESRGGKAPPEAPLVIDHREPLIHTLCGLLILRPAR